MKARSICCGIHHSRRKGAHASRGQMPKFVKTLRHSGDFAKMSSRKVSPPQLKISFPEGKHSQCFAKARTYASHIGAHCGKVDFTMRPRPIWSETCPIVFLFTHFHARTISHLNFLVRLVASVSVLTTEAAPVPSRQRQSNLEFHSEPIERRNLFKLSFSESCSNLNSRRITSYDRPC
jgi:hypothetical protein